MREGFSRFVCTLHMILFSYFFFLLRARYTWQKRNIKCINFRTEKKGNSRFKNFKFKKYPFLSDAKLVKKQVEFIYVEIFYCWYFENSKKKTNKINWNGKLEIQNSSSGKKCLINQKKSKTERRKEFWCLVNCQLIAVVSISFPLYRRKFVGTFIIWKLNRFFFD